MSHTHIIGVYAGSETGLAIWSVEDQKFLIVIDKPSHHATDVISSLKEMKILVKVDANTSNELDSWRNCFEKNGIDYEVVSNLETPTPLSDIIFKKQTGWQSRTTQQSRNAAMLVYGLK